MGSLSLLSRQKFSSNVVERCLQLCLPDERERLISELRDSGSLGELLRDVYGNYVIQSALSVATEAQLNGLLAQVGPVLSSLRTSGRDCECNLSLARAEFHACLHLGVTGDRYAWCTHVLLNPLLCYLLFVARKSNFSLRCSGSLVACLLEQFVRFRFSSSTGEFIVCEFIVFCSRCEVNPPRWHSCPRVHTSRCFTVFSLRLNFFGHFSSGSRHVPFNVVAHQLPWTCAVIHRKKEEAQ